MLFFSVLPLCNDPLLSGQSCHAHEVHDTSQVRALKPWGSSIAYQPGQRQDHSLSCLVNEPKFIF